MYEYKDKKGEHLHVLDGRPLIGVSSVGNVIAKQLSYWAAGKALEYFGWTPQLDENKKAVPKEKRLEHAKDFLKAFLDFDHEEYLKLLDTAYRAHDTSMRKSAKEGTKMHKELENYVSSWIKGEASPITDNREVQIFDKWALKNVKRFLWSEINCYSEKLWCGGISDCGVELNNGQIGIIDFKSSKETYNTQFWQIGGYDLLISENGGFTPEGDKIFTLPRKVDVHIVFPFGAKNPKPEMRYDVDSNKEAFKAELFLYKKINQ